MGLPLYEGVDWNITEELGDVTGEESPSLRGSGLKLTRKTAARRQTQSPSLRGSGLKLQIRRPARLWVRLPLYEGVDWNFLFTWKQVRIIKSPSLRGSGLKSASAVDRQYSKKGLPLYEGVDWNCRFGVQQSLEFCLPLYEGVDWNWIPVVPAYCANRVSLFTREWIEINCRWKSYGLDFRLPLYEGVDWNSNASFGSSCAHGLPLYEGVDWNPCPSVRIHSCDVSLFTREWIEIADVALMFALASSPSLRGSGLK